VKKTFLPIAAAGIWVTASEFARNEFLLKNNWAAHYASLGLRFETLPVNGVLWMVWSFALALVIFALSKKFSFKETIGLAWLAAFPMMWIALFNLQVLPLTLAAAATAIPLSLIEVAVAALIIQKLQ
jgi:hypothetical protein